MKSMPFTDYIYKLLHRCSCEAIAKEFSSSTSTSPSKANVAKALTNERALQGTLSADAARLEKVIERSEADDSDIAYLIGQSESKLAAINNYRSCKSWFTAY